MNLNSTTMMSKKTQNFLHYSTLPSDLVGQVNEYHCYDECRHDDQ